MIITETCAHFGLCGGCSKQNLSYDGQLREKETRVRRHLEEFTVADWRPMMPSPDIYFYRNKMEFSFGDQNDLRILGQESAKKVHIGLHPKGRFALVTPTPDCQLLSEESRKICAVVEVWAEENAVSVYVRKSGKGDLRHLVIREGKNTNERLVNLVAKSTTPHVDQLAERLKQSGLAIDTFLFSPYDGLSDVAKGDAHKIYWGDGVIRETLAGVTFRVSPSAFMQTNTRAAERMIDVLASWVPRATTLIDLYCGAGTIGLALAKNFSEVIGIEINAAAVNDARTNLAENGLSNVHFIEGKAEEAATQIDLAGRANDTVLVVDPPRAGLHPKMVDTILNWAVPNFIYVSCNPESLARDLRALSTRYDILAAQPMDFFPHTDHVETAVRLQLK